ncbi:hypothetical protein [Nonomuraea sp. NPDC049695]|uniref:hypothetical protein n=1 Tax=Nonomuraea sp. NPDC049695 TaxID=3154734 RepID=UPI003433B72D
MPRARAVDDSRSSVKADARDSSLLAGWRTSDDVALATAGDSTGLHLLLAEARNGYQWRTLATLSEPGMDTDQWIGNACLTGTADRVVAVYAPRHFTNRPALFARGGFAAVIDVRDGTVTKLKEQVALAYFNPGCGAGDAVALTQGADDEHRTSRLLRVDTPRGKVTAATVLPGDVGSAVPYRNGLVAAKGGALVSISPTGSVKTLAKTAGVPFDLRVDGQNGITFAELAGQRMTVRYYHDGDTRTLATADLGGLSVQAGRGGKVFLVGEPDEVRALPGDVKVVNGPTGGTISNRGELVVKSAARRGLRSGPRTDPRDTGISGVSTGAATEPIDVAAQVPATKAELSFEVAVEARTAAEIDTGATMNPRLAKVTRQGLSTTAADSPVYPGHTCSVRSTTRPYRPASRTGGRWSGQWINSS